MKRRRFLTGLAAAPAVPALLAEPTPQQARQTTQQQAPARGGGGRGMTSDVPKIPVMEVDETADTVTRFFSPAQFSALKKLAGVMMPPLKGNIGALDCDAVEFLDFLISQSPADRQQLYKGGLNALNAAAQKQFGKGFGELDNKQADAALKPLVVPVAWVYDPPKDPVKHFIFQAHNDIRTATRNSPEATKALANSGRRGGGAAGLYWNPIDPV